MTLVESRLTVREAQILSLAADGFRQKWIASRLGISPVTVKNLLTKFHDKHGTSGVTEAVALVLRNGWIK